MSSITISREIIYSAFKNVTGYIDCLLLQDFTIIFFRNLEPTKKISESYMKNILSLPWQR